MRARARDLGWSDAEVARRVGLKQTRYANYVTDRHEPDLATFVRICSVLGASASDLLGQTTGDVDEATRLRRKVEAAMAALDPSALSVLVTVVDGLVARTSPASPDDRPEATPSGRRPARRA